MSERPRQVLHAQTIEGPFPDEGPTHLIDALKARFGERILGSHSFRGDQTVDVGRDDLVAVLQVLRDEEPFAMDFLSDLCAVDYLELNERPRFAVVYHLFSSTHLHRLRVKVRVPEDDCRCPSVSALWKTANWAERETWEFYGIVFDGHPDLRHILLYEEFEGFPLRKDYPKQGEQPRLELRDHRPWPKPKPADIT